MPVFVLDRKVPTSVPLGNSHCFAQFLLPPQDIGPAPLSTSHHLPGHLRESSAACVCFFMKSLWEEKCPQKRTQVLHQPLSSEGEKKKFGVLDNLFEVAMQQKCRQCCSIIFTCSPAEETNLPLQSPWAGWGPTSFPSPASSRSTCWQICWHFGNLHLLCSQKTFYFYFCQIKYYCPMKNIFFSRNAFLPLSESSPNHCLYLHFTSSNKTKRRQ